MPGAIIRCSAFSRANQVDPIGTAGSYHSYLLLEHPLPWPKDAGDVPALAPLQPILARLEVEGRPCRVQLILARDGQVGDRRRVIHYRRPEGPFSRYERAAYETDAAGVVELSLAILDGSPPAADGYVARDVLVCTHGKRDVCCGTLGMAALADMEEMGRSYQFWRTSHTGGHRFAPTAATFPEGCFWASIDEKLLPRLVDRTAPVATAVEHLRGTSGLDSPAAQAVDRAGFAQHGWLWLVGSRSATEHVGREGTTVVELDFALPKGIEGRYDAVVRVRRTLPILDCGKPVEEATKQTEELEVVRFEHR